MLRTILHISLAGRQALYLLEDVQEGVKVGGVLIPAIRFADDQAMVSHTVRRL